MFIVVLLTWVITGVIVGFVMTKVVNLRGDDPRLGIGASVLGALVGGIMYCMISGTGYATWTVWGLLTSAIAAIVISIGWHLARSRTISHAKYTPRSSY